MRAGTGSSMILFEIIEDDQLLALGQPASLARPVDYDTERQPADDDGRNAFQQEEPLPVGETAPSAR